MHGCLSEPLPSFEVGSTLGNAHEEAIKEAIADSYLKGACRQSDYPAYRSHSFERKIKRERLGHGMSTISENHEHVSAQSTHVELGEFYRPQILLAMQSAHLTPRESQVIIFRYLQFSFEEIGNEIGVSKQCVFIYWRRAIMRLKPFLEEQQCGDWQEVYESEVRR